VKWFTIANFGVAAAARPITSLQQAAQNHSAEPICRCILKLISTKWLVS